MPALPYLRLPKPKERCPYTGSRKKKTWESDRIGAAGRLS
jgi:hypothetical protein